MQTKRCGILTLLVVNLVSRAPENPLAATLTPRKDREAQYQGERRSVSVLLSSRETRGL